MRGTDFMGFWKRHLSHPVGLLLILLVCAGVGGGIGVGVGNEASPVAAVKPTDNRPWLDASRGIDERARMLLESMTLAEKVGQMQQRNGIGGTPTGNADHRVADSALYERIRLGQLGSILNEINVPTVNAFQRIAVETSRLGVPLVFGRDVIHGYRTIFPIPLGQAASWNPELVEAAAAVSACEARSRTSMDLS